MFICLMSRPTKSVTPIAKRPDSKILNNFFSFSVLFKEFLNIETN